MDSGDLLAGRGGDAWSDCKGGWTARAVRPSDPPGRHWMIWRRADRLLVARPFFAGPDRWEYVVQFDDGRRSLGGEGTTYETREEAMNACEAASAVFAS